MVPLKKYSIEAKEILIETSVKDKIPYHFNQVFSFYSNALPYIKTLPSFHVGYDYATKLLIDFALDHIDFNGKNLLEIGCGLGNTLIHLANHFDVSCTGIDLNTNQIEICREKINSFGLNNRINIQQLNALDVDSNIGNYDIVLSEDSFSHIPHRNVLLDRICKVVKKNGLLVFSDLVKTNKIKSCELSNQQKAWRLWEIETKDSYIKIISNSGFKLIDYKINLGKTLLKHHIDKDMTNGDCSPDIYLNTLKNDKKQLLKEWGSLNYYRRYERLKTYKYIEEEKLDYNFFVAIKD